MLIAAVCNLIPQGLLRFICSREDLLSVAYNFMCFTPQPGIEQLQGEAGRILAVWSLFAVCLELFGICVEFFWSLGGICLEFVWSLFGICLEFVWNLF